MSESWQQYVDEQLVGTGYVSQAAIIGFDGNTRGHSKGFALKQGEGQTLVNLFKNPANVFASGVTVSGIKYMGVKGDSRSIYGKKAATGVCLVKTEQTILIVAYNETQQPGNASLVVEKLADYLIDNGL